MNNDSMIRDLTTGSPMKQLLVFSYPLILSNLLQQAYNMADMVIVGHYVGTAGLAALSSAGELCLLFLFLLTGFSNAGQIIIAQHIGAGGREKISSVIGTLFTFLFILGAVLCVVAIVFCDNFLIMLKIPEEAFGHAHDYSLMCFFGLLPVCGYNAVGAILRGMGDSRHPLVFITISSVLNIILDIIFVGPLGMGCFGAAFATVISQTVSLAVSIVFLYRRREAFGFDFKLSSFRINMDDLRAIVSLGLPLALQMGTVIVSMLYVNSWINTYGVVAAAATAVGNKLNVVATICTGAMNVAGASIIAQNFAAGKFDRVRITLVDILVIALAFCMFLALLLMVFPEQIFAFFDENAEVIALSRVYAPIAALSFFGAATRCAAMSLINGVGNSGLAFAGGMLDGIFARIGFSLFFAISCGMDVPGFWLGNAVAGQCFGVIAVIYYFSGLWKKRKLLVGKS